MQRKRNQRVRRRKQRGRFHRRHRLEDLLPEYFRPGTEAWEHFQTAKHEFFKGLRALLDQMLAAQERQTRRRRAGLEKIAVE